eukprot:m51a1_g11882 hypothetical protein (524) ;mRNA; r:575816-577500
MSGPDVASDTPPFARSASHVPRLRSCPPPSSAASDPFVVEGTMFVAAGRSGAWARRLVWTGAGDALLVALSEPGDRAAVRATIDVRLCVSFRAARLADGRQSIQVAAPDCIYTFVPREFDLWIKTWEELFRRRDEQLSSRKEGAAARKTEERRSAACAWDPSRSRGQSEAGAEQLARELAILTARDPSPSSPALAPPRVLSKPRLRATGDAGADPAKAQRKSRASDAVLPSSSTPTAGRRRSSHRAQSPSVAEAAALAAAAQYGERLSPSSLKRASAGSVPDIPPPPGPPPPSQECGSYGGVSPVLVAALTQVPRSTTAPEIAPFPRGSPKATAAASASNAHMRRATVVEQQPQQPQQQQQPQPSGALRKSRRLSFSGLFGLSKTPPTAQESDTHAEVAMFVPVDIPPPAFPPPPVGSPAGQQAAGATTESTTKASSDAKGSPRSDAKGSPRSDPGAPESSSTSPRLMPPNSARLAPGNKSPLRSPPIKIGSPCARLPPRDYTPVDIPPPALPERDYTSTYDR